MTQCEMIANIEIRSILLTTDSSKWEKISKIELARESVGLSWIVIGRVDFWTENRSAEIFVQTSILKGLIILSLNS